MIVIYLIGRENRRGFRKHNRKREQVLKGKKKEGTGYATKKDWQCG